MKKLNSIKKKNTFFFLLLVSSIFISNTFINLYYLSTLSPDFNRYSTYLSYFLEPSGEIFSEQGVLYYFIVSIFVLMNIDKFNYSEITNIANLGNTENLNILYVSDFELKASIGIQNGNLFFFLIGLTGFFKFLKLQKVDNHKIYLILNLLIFFPPAIQMRLTLKPEILGFSLLPWIMYYFTSYLKNRNIVVFLKLILIVPIVLTAKASMTGMLGIFFLLLVIQNFKSLNLKEIIAFLILSCLLFSFLYIENVNIINRSFFEREDLKTIYNQEEYNNAADPRIFYNINFQELIKHPEKNYHADSIIGITLIDTFGDYFKEYWDKDYTLSNKYRKDFIKSNSETKIDFPNRTLYLENWNFNLNYLRNISSLILSIFFFIFGFYFSIKKSGSAVLILSPFIGLLILIINSLGFPEYNFYPTTADTFKTFYYSFLLTLCFVEIMRVFLLSKLSFKKYLIIVYVFLICFITGFPKANNTELDYALSNINRNTTLCNVNAIYLNYSLIENNYINCTKKVSNETSGNSFKISNTPKLNIGIFSLTLLFALMELKLVNNFLLKTSKYLRRTISKF